jgi:hypothetical protein
LKHVGERNVAASVRQRLLNIASKENADFGFVLTRYALERVLYRLSRSPHQGNFVLKGALLFQVWADAPHRPTKDLDLLGRGSPSIDRCRDVFGEICAIETEPDGLVFSADTITAEKIKEDQEYEGVRVKFTAKLENARIPIQVDIGFGDAVTPELVEYPTLLASPALRVLAYPMESVIAEKVEAMVHLGMLNSRMKDFFDVWFLAKMFPFRGAKVPHAIEATFARRGTELNTGRITKLLVDLAGDANKSVQWRAFLRKSTLAAPPEFDVIAEAIREFLLGQFAASDSTR